jgi:hypothetical protein
LSDGDLKRSFFHAGIISQEEPLAYSL